MKIVHQVDYLNRDHGGPTHCIVGLCNAQALLGHDVVLLTTDSDYMECCKSFTLVCTHGNWNSSECRNHIANADVVHQHGIWLRSNHVLAKICTELSIPRVVNLHGTMDPWAMNQRKWKKRLAWHLYQKRDLRDAAAYISTGLMETESIARYLPRRKITELALGIDDQGDPKIWQERPVKNALFLSRLHEKKGIQDLIPVWLKLNPEGWELWIAGPDPDALGASLQARYALAEHPHIHFLGPVAGVEKANLYRDADILILPTYTENFGLVVPEALSVGTPVLTTSQTPWKPIEEIGAGWIIEPGQSSLLEGLSRVLGLTRRELYDHGMHGISYVSQNFPWNVIAQNSISIYHKVIKGLES